MRRKGGAAGAAVLIWGAMVLVAAPAHADTITVDTTDDSLQGGDGLTSLREAFIEASTNAVDDTIELAPGATYDLVLCFAGELQHTAVAQALTVEGNGATIHQTCPDLRVMNSSDPLSVLTVNDVMIQGGPNTGMSVEGAGILVDGSLVLNDSTVTGVDAGGQSALETESGSGFAITVTNSNIVANDANGIRTFNAGVLVTASIISDNTGSGIMLTDGNPLHIFDSTISNNGGRGASTTGSGPTTMILSNSTVSDNDLGGISCSGCRQLTVDQSDILDNGINAGEGTGGGIAFNFDYEPIPVDPFITITDSAIEGNFARRFGGGVAVGTLQAADDPQPSPIISIADSSISNNTTLGDGRHGGGLAIRTGSLAMVATTVVGNVAGSGGAVQSAGGGLYFREDIDDGIADSHDLILNGVTFDVNESTGRGGGADIASAGIIDVQLTNFFDNVSPTVGGGAYVSVEIGSIDGSHFSGNEALRGGGLFATNFPGANELYVSDSTFASNTATELGGGVAADDIAELTLENSTVTDNIAPSGGGISVGIDPMDDPETVVVRHTTVAGNSAPIGANIATFEGTLDIGASVVVQPLGGGANCSGAPVTLESQGRSFFSDASCDGIATDTVSAADPQLGPLGDNGGPTPTRLPAVTSPIGGLVPATECVLPTDQRGITRPQGTNCEPGSVEIAEVAAIMGTPGPDILVGTSGNDTIQGLGGSDLLLGLAGDDLLEGGNGNDVLIGGTGNDVLRGGAGRDVLVGLPGNDILDGGPGRDLCWFPGQLFPRDC
jgi:predicted outer membrane repeat protein